MNYLELLEDDLKKGYTKADLERLIGLPKNSLSGILKENKKLSRLSELKIEKWEVSEKPNPLDLPEIKKQMQLAKIKLTAPANPNSHYVDIEELRKTPIEMNGVGESYTTTNPNHELITKYETELSHLGTGQIAKDRRKWIEKQIQKLKNH